MASISDKQVRAFLLNGTKTGILAFTARDGRPLATPVWFMLEDDEIVFNTGKGTAKGKALARDPRVSVCVDLAELPFAFVQVQGVARISEDPDELLRTATEIARRYVDPERAAEFGRRNAVPGEMVVRVEPSKVVAEMDMTS